MSAPLACLVRRVALNEGFHRVGSMYLLSILKQQYEAPVVVIFNTLIKVGPNSDQIPCVTNMFIGEATGGRLADLTISLNY